MIPSAFGTVIALVFIGMSVFLGIAAGALTSVMLRLRYSFRKFLMDAGLALIGIACVVSWGFATRYGSSLETPGLVTAVALPILTTGLMWIARRHGG